MDKICFYVNKICSLHIMFTVYSNLLIAFIKSVFFALSKIVHYFLIKIVHCFLHKLFLALAQLLLKTVNNLKLCTNHPDLMKISKLLNVQNREILMENRNCWTYQIVKIQWKIVYIRRTNILDLLRNLISLKVQNNENSMEKYAR